MLSVTLSPKQKAAIASSADIVIFGGGNGPGKTFTLQMLLMLPEYLATPGCQSVIFAESNPKLEMPGGLVDKCKKWYAMAHPLGVDGYKQTPKKRWTFPCPGGGESTIDLSFIGEPGQWDAMEAAVICIDQIEQATEQQAFSVFGRNRSTTGVRCRIFATANPPEDGRDHWLTKMLTRGGWIGEDGFPVQEMAGRIRFYVKHPETDEFMFADTPAELAAADLLVRDVDGTQIPPTSVSFFPALIDDHPDANFRRDYKRKLAGLTLFERRRRLEGNWYVTEEAGKYFNAKMFPKGDYVHSRHARRVRSWDNAWSTAEKADWTPGVLESMEPDGRIWIEDMIRFRGTISHVERAIELVAEVDGPSVTIRLPKDAGPAGALQSQVAMRLGARGFHVVLTRDVGDKLTRSRSYQGCAERLQISLAKSHTTQIVALRMLDPFEKHDTRITYGPDGQEQPPQKITVPGLDRSMISTIDGWHDSFLADHIRFGRDTVNKKHIKKDAVDAAVGGYEYLTDGQGSILPEPLSDRGERTVSSIAEHVNRLFSPPPTLGV